MYHLPAADNMGPIVTAAALPLPKSPAGGNAPEITVSELAGAIKRALEDGLRLRAAARAKSPAFAARMPRAIATSR